MTMRQIKSSVVEPIAIRLIFLRRALMAEGKKTPAKSKVPPPKRRPQPPSEEDLGGGDICSLEKEPSTDDDKPLD